MTTYRILILTLLLLATACAQATPPAAPTAAPSATSAPPPTETPIPPPTFTPLPSFTPTATPEQGKRFERAMHFSLEDPKLAPKYYYRAFLQHPDGMSWGPDGRMYIADPAGRHIVRISPDGEMDETQTWSFEHMWNQNGPVSVAFSPDGVQYFTNGDHLHRVGEQDLSEIVNLEQTSYDIGQLAFSPSGELYYTKLEENGKLYRLDAEDRPHLLMDDLRYAYDLVFESSNVLYLGKNWQGEVLRINLTDMSQEIFTGEAGDGRIYLALDADGDLWVRSDDRLRQFSPDGKVKPFMLDGVEYGAENPDGGYPWGPSAGIEFDDQGGLWLASARSPVVRLAPDAADADDPVYTLKVIYAGFDPSAALVDADGKLIVYNMGTRELWRIEDAAVAAERGDEQQIEVLATLDQPGPVALAQDTEGKIYLGLPQGGIVRLEADGSLSSFADVTVESMIFATDGGLYALAWRNGGREIMRIDEDGRARTVLNKIDGQSLSDGWFVLLATRPDGGVYLFIKETQRLYLVDAEGTATLVRDYKFMSELGFMVFTGAPGGGYFFVSDHKGKLYGGFDDPGKETVTLARGFGNSFLSALALSPDGKYIYVLESGAIDKVPLQ